MATTQENKQTIGLMRGIRDRFRGRMRRQIATPHPMDWIAREVMRWDPFRMTQPRSLAGRDTWLPRFEVRENGTAIRIIADVPGVMRDELDIAVTGNRLIVSGRRESEETAKDESVHTWEREYGEFSRAFTLPDNVDVEHVTSELRDGVLTIVAPMKAGTRTRKIQVGGASPKS
jgi:HSP20 family protein